MTMGAPGPLARLIAQQRQAQATTQGHITVVVKNTWDGVQRAVRAKAQAALASQHGAKSFNSAMLESEVKPLLRQAVMTTRLATNAAQQHAVTSGQGDAKSLMLATAGVSPKQQQAWAELKNPATVKLAKRFDSGPLKKLFDALPDAQWSDLETVLLDGFDAGVSPSVTSAKLAEMLGMDLLQAMSIVRTEGNRAYRAASLQTYQSNSDIVQGWVWVADLDPRTCIACLSMNGTIHGLDEQLDDHINGRCAAAPSLAALTSIGGIDLPDGGVTFGPSSWQSGSDWFDDQDDETQQQILGPSRYALYVSGDLNFADLATTNSNAWGTSIGVATLAQMGIDPDTLAAALEALSDSDD